MLHSYGTLYYFGHSMLSNGKASQKSLYSGQQETNENKRQQPPRGKKKTQQETTTTKKQQPTKHEHVLKR